MFVQWGMRPKNNANVVKLFLQCKRLLNFVQCLGWPISLPKKVLHFVFGKSFCVCCKKIVISQ